MQDDEKSDVYDFGVILLEIIKGRPVKSEKQVDALRDQVICRAWFFFVLLKYVVLLLLKYVVEPK